MKKIALVFAAGLMAMTGAAMAEENLVIGGNVRVPGQDVPVGYESSALPTEEVPTHVPFAGIDEANAALEQNDAPVEVQVRDDGIRPNAKCGAAGLPPGLCDDEPVVPYPGAPFATVNSRGIWIGKFVSMESGEAFTHIPNEVPEEHRAGIEQLNEDVNAAVTASFEDPFGGGCTGACFRSPVSKGELRLNAKDLSIGAGASIGPLAPGDDAGWTPPGFDELFEQPGFDLASSSTEAGHSTGAGGAGAEGGASGDLGNMAIAAALVGGPALGALALYHRIRANHALNNKTRQMVFDAVVRSPGIGVNDAAKAAGCSYSTAAYHLERLVEERLLVASEDGRRARFFKNGGAFSQAERDFVPILQSQEAMNVLQVIVENPWCYRAEVAQKLGVSGPTVNWHLKKLMASGTVKEMREGRVSYLYADKKVLSNLGANLVGKLPDELVGRLRFDRRPDTEYVEPAASLPETGVPEVGVDELELAPLPESR